MERVSIAGLRMGLSYRTAQFFRALVGKPKAEDVSLVDTYLPPALAELFHQMNHADQVHGLQVLRGLLNQGERQADLLAAALIHDVGKSQVSLRLWERALIVVAMALIPNAAQRWAKGEPSGWRRPFVVATQHPSWGAEMIRQAGGSPDLVALVRRHQECPPSDSLLEIDRLLLRLQQADGTN